MTAVWVAVLVALVALAYVGMWRGWRNRAGRHDLPEPEWLDGGWVAATDTIPVTYVSTTTAGNWLDRVTAHGLGSPSSAALVGHQGALVVLRDGARSFRIPGTAIAGTRRDQGIAGKVRNRDGLAVVTWRLGGLDLDTGFRPRLRADLSAIEREVALVQSGGGR